MRRFQEKYVQSRPNVNTVILVFTKVYAERFFNFFASMGGQKGSVFYIYYERITGYAQSEIFLSKEVSFYPSISPFTMKECEGYACRNLMLTNAEEGKSLRIARRRKYFV